jgi:hypothetical protein
MLSDIGKQVLYSGKLSREKTFVNFENKRVFAKLPFAKSQREALNYGR